MFCTILLKSCIEIVGHPSVLHLVCNRSTFVAMIGKRYKCMITAGINSSTLLLAAMESATREAQLDFLKGQQRSLPHPLLCLQSGA